MLFSALPDDAPLTLGPGAGENVLLECARSNRILGEDGKCSLVQSCEIARPCTFAGTAVVDLCYG